MGELRLPAVTVEQTPGTVKWNYEGIKKALGTALEEYRGLVYTDETIGMAKQDSKTLRDLSAAIDQRRLEVRRNCLAPFEVIDRQARELIDMINEPLAEIKKQADAYEQKRRDRVRAEIRTYWDDQNKALPESIREKVWAKIYDTRWENVSTAKKTWREAISAGIQTVMQEIDTIRNFDERFSGEGIRIYEKDLNLALAVGRMNEIRRVVEEQKRREEEKARQEREAAERRLREAVEKQAAEAARKAAEEKLANEAPVAPTEPNSEQGGTNTQPAPQNATVGRTESDSGRNEAPAPGTPQKNAFRAAVKAREEEPAEPEQKDTMAADIASCTMRFTGPKDAINRICQFAKYSGVQYKIIEIG